MLKRLWAWIFKHRHDWITTHTNRWQIPTRRYCYKCGCVASIETWKEEPRLTYRWVYEYGNGYVTG